MSNQPVSDQVFSRAALDYVEWFLGDTLGVIVRDASGLRITRKGDSVKVSGRCSVQIRVGTFCDLYVEMDAKRDTSAVADDKLGSKSHAAKAFKPGFGDKGKFLLGDKKIRVKKSSELRDVYDKNYCPTFSKLTPRAG